MVVIGLKKKILVGFVGKNTTLLKKKYIKNKTNDK